MYTDRERVFVRFNQGMDAGGSDPRVPQTAFQKVENLYLNKGILVQREGTTNIGRAARGLSVGNTPVVLVEPNQGFQVVTTTINNTRTNNVAPFSPTVWNAVVNVTADGESGILSKTPVINVNGEDGLFVQDWDGTNAVSRVYFVPAGGGAKRLVHQLNGASQLAYDAETRFVYAVNGVNATHLQIGRLNCATTPTFTTLSNIDLQYNRLNANSSFRLGISNHCVNPSTDPTVFVKRLMVAYFSNDGIDSTNYALVLLAINSAGGLGNTTNESNIATVSLVTGTLGRSAHSIRDLGPTNGVHSNTLTGVTIAAAKINTNAAFIKTGSSTTFTNTFTNAGKIGPVAFPAQLPAEIGNHVVDYAELDVINSTTYQTRLVLYNTAVINVLGYSPEMSRPFYVNTQLYYPALAPHKGDTSNTQVRNAAANSPQRDIHLLAINPVNGASNAKNFRLSARPEVGQAFWAVDAKYSSPNLYLWSQLTSTFSGPVIGHSDNTNGVFLEHTTFDGNRRGIRIQKLLNTTGGGAFLDFAYAPGRNVAAIGAGSSWRLYRDASWCASGFPWGPPYLRVSIANNASTEAFDSLNTVRVHVLLTATLKDGIVRSVPTLQPTNVTLTNVNNILLVKTLVTDVPIVAGYDDYENDTDSTRNLEVYATRPGDSFFVASSSPLVSGDTLSSPAAAMAKALYTQDELENAYPYDHTIACSYKGRYCYVANGIMYYSKPTDPGVVTEFNETLSLDVPVGEERGLARCGERLVYWTDQAAFVTDGEGFGAAAGGSNFVPFQQIADIGAHNHLCIVNIPTGVLFLGSDQCIYMFSLDMELTRVGSFVDYYTKTYQYTCAAHNKVNRYAIFTSATTDAPALVYAYESGTWSIFTGAYSGARYITCLPDGRDLFGGGLDPNSASNTNAGDAYRPVYISSNTSNETMNVATELAMLDMGQKLGDFRWKKCTVLLENKTNHVLTKKVAYDGDPYWSPEDDETYNSNSLATYDGNVFFGSMANSTLADQVYAVEFSGSRQKTDALRIGLYASNVSRNTVSFIGMSLEYKVRGGSKRLGPTRKMG